VENESICLQEKGRFLYKELHGLVICVLPRANPLSFVGLAFGLPITHQDERFQRTGLSVTLKRSSGVRTSSVIIHESEWTIPPKKMINPFKHSATEKVFEIRFMAKGKRTIPKNFELQPERHAL
jgi:hypothetical protein